MRSQTNLVADEDYTPQAQRDRVSNTEMRFFRLPCQFLQSTSIEVSLIIITVDDNWSGLQSAKRLPSTSKGNR
jgi:hypothetical protein